MNERLDPEEVRAIVGRIKAEAVHIVEGHGGIVNQFVGDEVMALFGVPQAHEDDPVRAVRAAHDLHAMVHTLAPAVESRIGAPLRLHSGISAGLIVTGTEDQRDGTFGVTGDAVNTGARLAAHAEADASLQLNQFTVDSSLLHIEGDGVQGGSDLDQKLTVGVHDVVNAVGQALNRFPLAGPLVQPFGMTAADVTEGDDGPIWQHGGDSWEAKGANHASRSA